MHGRLTAPHKVTGNCGLVAMGGRALLTALLAVWLLAAWGTAPVGAAEPTEAEVAAYRHNGLYHSGGGPRIISAAADEGKT